jgi:hypothetical protein
VLCFHMCIHCVIIKLGYLAYLPPCTFIISLQGEQSKSLLAILKHNTFLTVVTYVQ